MELKHLLSSAVVLAVFASCNNETKEEKTEPTTEAKPETKKEYLSQPLVSHIYTADPSAHVFNGRIYIYPSMIPQREQRR
jgi:arginine deiminase